MRLFAVRMKACGSVISFNNGDRSTRLKELLENSLDARSTSVEIEITGAGRRLIRVRYNGMGIPEEDLPHIWDEFFRAKNAHRSGIIGTGLGLSIVKQFVDRFGGQVSATSNLGKGTTFTVLLKAK